MDKPHIEKLTGADLGWRCPEEWLGFRSTRELEACRDLMAQREAVASVRLGVRLRAPGYNVFVAGLSGTGRTSTVRRILREEAGEGPAPQDICFVFNFEEPRRPQWLKLPAGTGKELAAGAESAADLFKAGVAALRASGTHRQRREAVSRRFREQQGQLIESFQKEVSEDGFALVEVSVGDYKRQEVAPLVDGQPVAIESLDDLVEAGKLQEDAAENLRQRHPVLIARFAEVSSLIRRVGRELEEALTEADRKAGEALVNESIEEMRAAVGIAEGEHEALDRHLSQVRGFLREIVPMLFTAGDALPPGAEGAAGVDPLGALEVNVLVDRTGQKGRPVVEEAQPTVRRLLGSIEVLKGPDGSVRAGLGGLRAGALHRADGGFLLVNAMDLISEEGGWTVLRRAMRSEEGAFATSDDEPGPLQPLGVPIDVKIILVGPLGLRDRIAEGDLEFEKLFKVVSLFSDRVPLEPDTVMAYACFLARVCREEGLPAIDAKGVARMLQEMVRVAGGSGMISTRFRLLADLAREAGWFASEEGAAMTGPPHVEDALRSRRERSGLMSRRIHESIRERVLNLELEGARVGQINGLAVVETSLERFGYPVRLTATSSVGGEGIIDIEREAELSGQIHTKASLILAGFLRSTFAQRIPLTLTASLCFEQSYGGVEGDSASAAELAVLLSSLSGVPIRQDVAVTGAVDQRGQILAVGGVNEKVEGFWRACRGRTPTGSEGVILPAASVSALQLDPAVAADVEAGRFHVWSAHSIEGVVETLTGLPFGAPGDDGQWPEGTIGYMVSARLTEMAAVMNEYPGAY